MRRWLGAASALLAIALPSPAGAHASYGYGAEIVSADFARGEQGDDATTFAAISADGRFVAIQTRARNLFPDGDPDPPGRYRVGGIFRFDTATRSIELVADGDFREEAGNALVLRGAQNPSISGDGRFVAFSTAQQLVAADTNHNVDVYVRDMTVPVRSPGAFDLVSAKDGGDLPASYGPPTVPIPSGDLGADVTRGAAISRDGAKVVFRVTEPDSDLPDLAAVATPGFQVFVRDREANTTTLVTRAAPGGAAAGGAIGAAGISGDGTTVIWAGQNAPLQTEFLPGENAELPGFSYYLWQRYADGPSAPTRRVTGLSDPDDPACQPTGPVLFDESTLGPCFGPLARAELGISANSNLPAISFDGRRVAFLTNSGARPNLGTGIGLDLFVTEMSPGLTRKAATLELTREGGSASAESAPVESLGMSADGRYVAVVTARTKFVLPALAQLGPPRTVADVQDLYVVDLERRTVERATRSYGEGDIDAPVVAEPTLSADGSRVAFVSFASNLFFGDANQRTDAFLVSRQPDPGAEPPSGAFAAGGGRSTIESSRGGPRISVRARSRPGGVVELTVSVPAAGGVRAVAKGRAGEPRRLRALATDDARARGARRTAVKLTLRPVRRYRGELRRLGALPARARVSYVAARGARRASASRRIVFREVVRALGNGRRDSPGGARK